MNRTIIASLALLATSFFTANAQDIAAGEKVFKKCKACHTATEAKNKIGPHLLGIVDRPAGSVEGFKYSKAMVAAAEGGLVWTAEDIAEYVAKPTAKLKGTKMAFSGLKKEEDVSNLIAYLAAQEAQ